MRNTFAFAIFIGGLLFSQPSHAQNNNGPSFDCTKAKSEIEKQICSSAQLKKKDNILNQLYLGVKTSFYGTGASSQNAEQIAWIKGRNDCVKPELKSAYNGLEACLISVYNQRIGELAASNLFRNPDLAFNQIKEFYPESSSLYHALYDYVTIPKSPSRDEKIAKLLEPHFENLKANWPFPFGTLLDENINKPIDVLVDDKKFATAFTILALDVEGEIMLPCDALIKKPDLIGVLSPFFGSSLDGQLVNSDCSAMSPPLPKFATFMKNVYHDAPECTGTIRFGIWRDIEKKRNEVILGRFDLLKDEIRKNENYEASTLKMLQKNNKSLTEARDELFKYYQQYKGKSDFSKQQIEVILRTLFDDGQFEC